MNTTDFVNLKPGKYFSLAKEGIYCHLSSLRIILKMLDSKDYLRLAFQGRSGAISINPKIEKGKEFITEKEISKTFRAIFSEINDLVDVLLAYSESVGMLTVNSNWTIEKSTQYCEDRVYEMALSISRNSNRTFPSKCRDLNFKKELNEILLGLNDIRVALEHHKHFPKKDIKLISIIQYTQDESGRKFTDALPIKQLKKGQKFQTTLERVEIIKKKNQRLKLTENDIERICELLDIVILQGIHDHFVKILERKGIHCF